jgi:hypothetical protein
MTTTPISEPQPETLERLHVPHFVRGEVRWGDDREHHSRDLGIPFVTPAISFDEVVIPRSEPSPMADVPIAEILDFLEETRERLDLDRNPYLQESLPRTAQISGIPLEIMDRMFRLPLGFLQRDAMEYRIERMLGSLDVVDGWVQHTDPTGRASRVRAVPPRLIHMVAGNAPIGVMQSIADGCLVKAVNLFKVPSVDPFTTVAVLRTMADIDPGHPVVRSLSALYWRGGDAQVEGVLYRAQYFDKLVAWGGGEAITNAAKYVGPGFQLVAFDPKTSMAVVGREAFASDEALHEAADLLASDAAGMNQDACVCPRHAFVEGTVEEVDRFCEVLIDHLVLDRRLSGGGPRTSPYIREAVDGLRFLEPDYRTWGGYDGRGLVVRSPEPVDWHPQNKTLNVVPVRELADAARYATVATQTVGVWPYDRKVEVRDRLAHAGVQRICRLGHAGMLTLGIPHDGMYPLHRFVNWVVDDDG